MVNATVEGIFNGTIVELFRPPQDNGNGSSTGNNGTSPVSSGGSGSSFNSLTDQADTGEGTAQADSIEGLKGDDTIEGRSGGDIILGIRTMIAFWEKGVMILCLVIKTRILC